MTATIIPFPTVHERSEPDDVRLPSWQERAAAEHESYARAVRDQAAYGWHVPSLRMMLDLAVEAGCEDVRERAKAWLDEQLNGSARDRGA